MEIVPVAIQAVVMCGQGNPNRYLAQWLSEERIPWRPGPSGHNIEVCRNQAITRFRQEDIPRGRKYLMMLDDDIVPIPRGLSGGVPSLNAMLGGGDDLLWCAAVGREGKGGHVNQGDFGGAACRMSADLITRMGAPWFRADYNETWTQRITCNCDHFRRRAIECGATPKLVGIAGHQQGGEGGAILIPNAASKHGWSLLWPTDIEQANRAMARKPKTQSPAPSQPAASN